jgi:hypothetical protein
MALAKRSALYVRSIIQNKIELPSIAKLKLEASAYSESSGLRSLSLSLSFSLSLSLSLSSRSLASIHHLIVVLSTPRRFVQFKLAPIKYHNHKLQVEQVCVVSFAIPYSLPHFAGV